MYTLVRGGLFSTRVTLIVAIGFPSNCFSGAFIIYSVRNEQLGAMRQKMAIFKERNRVSRGTIVSHKIHSLGLSDSPFNR